MKSALKNLTAALIATSVFVALVGAPSPADACSPPPEGIFAQGDIKFEQPIPATGAIAFRVQLYLPGSFDALSVEVHDPVGVAIEGSVSHHPVRELASSTPEQNAGTHLVIWTPTAALRPQHQYTATIRATSVYDPTSFTIDETVTFKTGPKEMQQPRPASVREELSFRVTETPGATECCYSEEACGAIGSCGSCQICWPTRYTYLPTIDIPVVFPQSETDQQVFHVLEDSTGASTLYWDQEPLDAPISVQFLEDDPGPYCVTLRSFALATQESVSEQQFCFEQSQLPPYDERDLGEEYDRSNECPDEPDAGGLPDTTQEDVSNPGDVGKEDVPDAIIVPDATEEPDAQQPDTNTENPLDGEIAGAGCGCSSAPDGPNSPVGLFFFFLALAATRLSLFRPAR